MRRLLDDVVEAVAASDAATVFRAVDRVIQTGHDPRRFVEDLLERFRDLIIVQAMPESAQTILRGMPADQIARLQNQAHNLGAAELSRAADVTNTALTEMTGATSPRLHLELLCARILLPSSEQTERGIAARIDRVERRLNYAGNDVGAPAPAGSSVSVAGTAPERNAPEPTAPAVVRPPAAAEPQPPAPAAPAAAREAEATPAAPASQEAPPREQVQQPQPAEARQPLTAPRVSTSDWPVDEPAAGRTTAGPGAGPAADVRRAPAQESPAQASAFTGFAGTSSSGAGVAGRRAGSGRPIGRCTRVPRSPRCPRGRCRTWRRRRSSSPRVAGNPADTVQDQAQHVGAGGAQRPGGSFRRPGTHPRFQHVRTGGSLRPCRPLRKPAPGDPQNRRH